MAASEWPSPRRIVMAGCGPAIHDFLTHTSATVVTVTGEQDVDGRATPGHDDGALSGHPRLCKAQRHS